MYKLFQWQMCYDCAKALGGCSWADNFEPVNGWQAEKTHKSRGSGKYADIIDSYDILFCPEFEPDKPIPAASLDFEGCIRLLCAIYRGASKEYTDALAALDNVVNAAGVFTKEYTEAFKRLKLAEKSLTPEICKKLKVKYQKEKEKAMGDWTGNYNSIYKSIGASNHTGKERETNDYYATDPKAAELLCDMFYLHRNIWEPACGEGHLSEVFKAKGYDVHSTDLVDRGYGIGGIDFLQCSEPFCGDIITNPPYKYAQQFVEKALSLIPDGYYVGMFLKLTFLEGKARRKLFDEHPPKFVYAASGRILCAKNADFDGMMRGAARQ